MKIGLTGLALAAMVLASPALAQEKDAYAVRDCFNAKNDAAIVAACSTVLTEDWHMKVIVAMVHDRRGAAFTSLGTYDEAIEDFNSAIAIDDEFARAYYNRGVALESKGDHVAALADFDAAIRHKYEHPAWAYNGRAWVYYKMDRPLDALRDIERALDLDPQFAEAWDTLAHVDELFEGGEEGAVQAYKRALELKPGLQESIDGLKRLGAE